MSAIQIHALQDAAFDTLFEAWEDAFSDYERTWSKTELQQTLQRRGYALTLSFGAFDDGRLVSFILNCPGDYDGSRTAYDAGTGTIKSHRGKGLVKKIFDASMPILKQAGMEQYLLEVLQHNTTAVKIYTDSGFEINRSFNYFVKSMNEWQAGDKTLPAGYTFKATGLEQNTAMAAMWDFAPSWQNSFDSVARTPNDFIICGVYHNEALAGYGVTDPSTGDITQLAVSRGHRRKGIGTAILKELARHNRHQNIKVINTDTRDAAMTAFLSYNGMTLTGQQYEMVKAI